MRICLLLVNVSLYFCCAVAGAQHPTLEFNKWSGSLNVPDPVAISFDHQGRAYVTQTQRRKANDLDIRRNSDWIPNDVAFQSVQDKLDFYHERMSPEKNDKRRVADLNEDGVHDYRDLMALSERIHRLTDTDADGTADEISLFAEGFNTEVTGIAAGVLHHHGSVYTTIAPDVWKLTDTNNDGTADQREIMATGFGLHIAYAGHDMHGLTVGPDGKIYWSIGDKGISAQSKEGQKFHFPNQGGVMRCNPDGSDFEVFAHGLRNVQELAFDEFGNLFGVDNDSDQKGERERFVYIVKGMDAGWRCNYQYRSGLYNPWTAERLWELKHDDQPAYIIPPIEYSIDGPAGFAFNPGTALSPDYVKYFFLTGAPNGHQIAFRVRPDGASFVREDVHEIGSGVPLVGINFGPDGGLYGVDWGGGYPLNQKGAVWKIDVPKNLQHPAREETQQLLATIDGIEDGGRLLELMGHIDQRVRLEAQFQLVDMKKDEMLRTAAFSESAPLLQRVHAIWGLGQRMRTGAIQPRDVYGLLKDDEEQIQIQTLRILGDVDNADPQPIAGLLSSPSKAVQFQTLITLGGSPNEEVSAAVRKFAASLNPSETYLRHAVARAMSTCCTTAELVALTKSQSRAQRLCAVVALRMMKAEGVAKFLRDDNSLVAAEAARAIHDDFSIPSAMPDLAAAEFDAATATEPLVRRIINANFRLGTPDNFAQLTSIAARPKLAKELRLEALYCLENWLTPPPLDRVTGRARSFTTKRSAAPSDSTVATLRALLTDSEPAAQAAAMRVYKMLKLPLAESALVELIQTKTTPPDLAVESLNLLQDRNSAKLDELLTKAAASDHSKVQRRAFELLTERRHPLTVDLLTNNFGNLATDVRQRVVELMSDLQSEAADDFLLGLAGGNDVDLAENDTAIEYIETLQKRSAENSKIAKLLSRISAQLEPQANAPEASWLHCMTGGDAARGEKLFNTHLQAQCVRCHRVGKKGSNVGPNLAEIAVKRKPRDLLRSIVAPSAEIEPKYRSVVVILASGKTLTGVRVKETADTLTIANNQGKEIKIETDDIDDVIEQNVSIMPEMKTILNPRQIRDLVAYLSSLK